MNQGLELFDGRVLPMDTVTQKLAWIGTTGSGKTYGATKMAELMWHVGAQFVAIDPMGIWWGLRLGADGESDGIPITVFGGRKGDLPLSPDDGHLIAEVVVKQGISAIVDISHFDTDADKSRFCGHFADRLYRLKQESPSAIHLFLEEAHEFIPQNSSGSEAQMLHYFNRIWKQGRNYGIGGSIITQRPQDVNKKALELTACLFAFNISGTNALKAVKDWTKEPEVDQLPKLPIGKEAGKCLLWSPSWLSVCDFDRILPKDTYHASFDPHAPVFANVTADRTLPAIALEAIRAAMAEAGRPANQDEPIDRQPDSVIATKFAVMQGELQKERELRAAAEAELEWQKEAIKTVCVNLYRQFAPMLQMLGEYVEHGLTKIEPVQDGTELVIEDHISNPGIMDGPTVDSYESPPCGLVAPKVQAFPSGEAAVNNGAVTVAPKSNASAEVRQRILDNLAELEAINMPDPTRAVLAMFCGMSHTTKSFAYTVTSMIEAGELVIPSAGRLQLTILGRTFAKPDGSKGRKTLATLHEGWLARVGKKQPKAKQMLALLLSSHPEPIGRNDLARLMGVATTTKSFAYAASMLSDLGITQNKSGKIALTSLLFPEGLK